MFACVGDCDPNLVGRGIRRGVLRAERVTGVPKPALLCLMGAAGAVHIGRGTKSRHVFPSYRFPESAARALSRAAQYAAFRRQPGGLITWYDDVDSGAARSQVKQLLDTATGPVLVVEGEKAREILRWFGISAFASGPTGNAEQCTSLEVHSDPSFGPLIYLVRAPRPPVVRITPLTDRDVREIVQAAELPVQCGMEELLGRVSQLVEELPWLCAMNTEIRAVSEAGMECRAVLSSRLTLEFCRT